MREWVRERESSENKRGRRRAGSTIDEERIKEGKRMKGNKNKKMRERGKIRNISNYRHLLGFNDFKTKPLVNIYWNRRKIFNEWL